MIDGSGDGGGDGGASKVRMFPNQTAAASLVPSLEDVMSYQAFVLPTEVSSVHVVFTGVKTLSESRVRSRTLNAMDFCEASWGIRRLVR